MPRLVLVAIVSVLLGAQSQPPPPTPFKRSQEKEADTRDKKTGSRVLQERTSPQSTIVSSPQATQPQLVGQQATQNTNAEASTNRWIMVFTGVLALASIFQYFIYRKQTNLMERALNETTKAADA